MAFVIISCVLLVAIAALVYAGRSSARSLIEATNTARDDMGKLALEAEPLMIDEGVVMKLPKPVVTYLDLATPEVDEGVRVARIRQRTTVRDELGDKGKTFEAEQLLAMEPPGYVWSAVGPGLTSPFRSERFDRQEGDGVTSTFGTFNMDESKGREYGQAAALRFWAEALTFPEAVCHPDLSWDPVSAERARLFVKHREELIDVVVTFSSGLPSVFHSQRFRNVAGAPVLTPWSANFKNWEIISGRLYPRTWESVWHLPEGDLIELETEIVGLDVQ